MLRVASERFRSDALSGRVAEDVDETEVITSADEGLLLVHVDTVNVVTTSLSGEDTIDQPAELGVVGSPESALVVRGTARILIAARQRTEEEELITIADRSNHLGVSTPIESGDSSVMLAALTKADVAGFYVVHVDVGIVGADSEVFTIGTVFSNLEPFLRVADLVLNGTRSILTSDSYGTIVGADSDVTVDLVDSDASSALRLGPLAHGRSLVLSGLTDLSVDLGSLNELSILRAPLDDLVVITSGPDAAVIDIKTPDLTIVVRLNESALLAGGHVCLDNGSSSQTNKEEVVLDIDGSGKRTEVIAAHGSAISGVDDLDGTVTATRVELASVPHDGADETLSGVVEAVNGLNLVTSPHVDVTNSGTSIGAALVISGNGSEGSSLVATEHTLLLVLLVDIKELASLDTGGPEVVLVGLVKGEIPDGVGATLDVPEHLAGADIEEGDDMVVGSISSCNSITISGNSNSGNTSSVSREGLSTDLLTRAGIPDKNSGVLANLTGDTSGSITSSVAVHGHDVVAVMVLRGSGLLGFVLDLATTEELLGVGRLVKNDTEASSHVADVALRVVVNSHSRVLASVAIDVFELVSLIGLRLFNFRMIVGLDSGSSLPGLDGKELLTFLNLFGLKLKEIRFGLVLVIDGLELTGLLVHLHAAVVLEFFRNITPVLLGRFTFSRVAGSHFKGK